MVAWCTRTTMTVRHSHCGLLRPEVGRAFARTRHVRHRSEVHHAGRPAAALRHACRRRPGRGSGAINTAQSEHMEDERGMIPMGGPDEIDAPEGAFEAPPTIKARNAVEQEVGRLLEALVPERAAHRMGAKTNEVERFRMPRGCVLQARDGAVTVSWFPDSAQGAELGELQVVLWRGTVSRPGSSQRASGAQVMEEMVLRPGESPMGGMVWRTADGKTLSTDALAAHCATLLERWTKGGG